jgi:hypothetical protein
MVLRRSVMNATKTAQYRLFTYDVWGNENDGWDVNDVFKSGVYFSTGVAHTDAELTNMLGDLMGLTLQIDVGSDENTIYFSDENGKPVCELRIEE